MKAGKDPLVSYRTRLEDLDIKVLVPYVLGATTHVVSSKRNTAKGLQALINAQYIVAETYIDALIYATTPDNLDELESLSPLEEDFDANWPDATSHLPAKSKEPSERPAEDFKPNAQRSNVFDGYSFVFCDDTQFTNLQAPITNGGGKALEFTLQSGKTTTEDVVRYVKGVAGEKGLGEFEDGSEGKGVVVVAFRGKKGFEDWAANLVVQIALALGQRLIEQSEFLDAILLNDASMLRRPLPSEESECKITSRKASYFARALTKIALGTDKHIQSSVPSQKALETEKTPEPEAPQPRSRRARARGTIVSRFKGFDDDDYVAPAPTSSHPDLVDSPIENTLSGSRSQRYSVSSWRTAVEHETDCCRTVRLT